MSYKGKKIINKPPWIITNNAWYTAENQKYQPFKRKDVWIQAQWKTRIGLQWRIQGAYQSHAYKTWKSAKDWNKRLDKLIQQEYDLTIEDNILPEEQTPDFPMMDSTLAQLNAMTEGEKITPQTTDLPTPDTTITTPSGDDPYSTYVIPDDADIPEWYIETPMDATVFPVQPSTSETIRKALMDYVHNQYTNAVKNRYSLTT